MTLETHGKVTEVDGNEYYEFSGFGDDRVHPRSKTKQDQSRYGLIITNGRLNNDFSWQMDVISDRENDSKEYTYFGTYFTRQHYDPRIRDRPLKMTKPNNGWVLQGCISCKGCNMCDLFSGVSLFPDQLSRLESVSAAQETAKDVFNVTNVDFDNQLARMKPRTMQGNIFNGDPKTKIARVLDRLERLYENIGSPFKQGAENSGALRKRYDSFGQTGTVFQGSDTPQELYSNTRLFITERFKKKRNKGSHLTKRLENIYKNLCMTHRKFCIAL
jgi:hypothetical protein